VVLDRKGKVQVRGWMGNGRGCVHVSKRTHGRELGRKGRGGEGHVRRASGQAGRGRFTRKERKKGA
jgi:hypothetical protein